MSRRAGPKALDPGSPTTDAERVKEGSDLSSLTGTDGPVTGALTELDRDTSLQLLAGLEVGRVAWAEGDRVMVFPLNFVLEDGWILAQTPSDTIFEAAAQHAVLTFQGDEIEPGVHTGWTVLISGPAEEVVKPAEVARVRELVKPWRIGAHFRVLRIRVDQIAGRRLRLRPGSIERVYLAD
jgi:uncharacterized protein